MSISQLTTEARIYLVLDLHPSKKFQGSKKEDNLRYKIPLPPQQVTADHKDLKTGWESLDKFLEPHKPEKDATKTTVENFENLAKKQINSM